MIGREEAARLIDHTLLRPGTALSEIRSLVAEARDLGVWAVCVGGAWVEEAVGLSRGTGLRVVTVCGFPSGSEPTDTKVREAVEAVTAGADEVDMVADLEAIRAFEWGRVEEDVAAVRAAMTAWNPDTVLKVILETAEFGDEAIVEAARASERAGADFVKTSTGFSDAGGASARAVHLLAEAVGGRLGIKASGGIRTAGEALTLVEAGATRLGTSRTRGILAEWPHRGGQ